MLTLHKYLKLVVFALLIIFFACNKETDNVIPPGPGPIVIDTLFRIPQIKDIIMYEVNLRAFSENGDLQGVISRLSDIKELGINVIWLMPIHPIGEINSVNSPYSVKNYKEVNPEFGTLDDVKTLINYAHSLGIAVILDWVANHTAWDNPWIDNTDWYTQDGNGNIVHPPGTNWQDVADLNFDNLEMRLSMIEAMQFWVTEAQVDGFRCDAADFVPFDFWRQAIDSLNRHTNKDLIMLAEGARNDHFTAGFDMNFSWDYYNTLKNVFSGSTSAGFLISTHNSEYNNVPDGKHKLRFTTNHDESAWDQTPMVLFNGKEGALAASVVTSFMGGVPLIYGSQEIGVEENIPFFSNSPIDWSLNPDMLETYQNLFNFYKHSQASKQGVLETFTHSSILAFTREFNEELVLVMVNTDNTSVNYDLPEEIENSIWLNAIDSLDVILEHNFDFEPYEYLVLTKQ